MYDPRSELVWVRSLVSGATGEDARRLQEWLALWGHAPGAIDGEVGRLTLLAAAKFRAAHRLGDGPVDPELCRALSEPLLRAMQPMVFPAGTTLAAAALARARRCAELNAHELPGNRGPWVRYFSAGVEGPSQRWCSYFVRSCLLAASMDLQLSAGAAPPLPFKIDPGVDRTVRAAQAAGRFVRRGSARAFDLGQSLFVVPDRDGSGHSHIGFVVGPAGGDEVETIEGNGLPLDAPVLTPTGWRRIGDLSVGDQICGPDGDVGAVTGVFPQGVRPVFRLRMSDGSEVVADDQHRWAVKLGKGRRGRRAVLTTAEIVETVSRGRNVSLPAIQPVALSGERPDELPLHPYLLGLLLGDGGLTRCAEGSPGQVRFTQRDQGVRERMVSLLPAGCTLTHVAGDDYRVVGVPLRNALRELDLAGLGSPEKFVPDRYLWANVDSRLELLRGLMDTDGSIDPSGRMEFCSTSRRLAQAVQFLVQSLGGKVTIYLRTGVTYTSKTQADPKAARDAYILRNLRFAPHSELNPFHMERKAQRVAARVSGWKRGWSIQSVIPEGTTETVCISVSTPSSLYITEHFIPTHNTNLAGAAEGTHVLVRKRKRALVDYLALEAGFA